MSWVFGLAILIVVPFTILVRGSVFFYREWALGMSLSLACAVILTVLLFLVGTWIIRRGHEDGPEIRRMLIRGTIAIACTYAGYAAFYVASANAVPDEIREEYQTIHPLLRLAASPVIFFDPSAVTSNEGRIVEDYRLMGLSVNEANLHFVQTDGLIHSLDLGTDARVEWRNRGIELGFWALGFHSLRHLGVADHLHVSLRFPGQVILQ